jgi:hypothetical protein
MSREHLLDRLARYSQFPGDVRLGEARVDEGAEQVAAFGVKLLGSAHVVERLGADLPDPGEGLLMGRYVWMLCHAVSMTTTGCRCQPSVVKIVAAAPCGTIGMPTGPDERMS